jgi:VCBS repeat-containing protein
MMSASKGLLFATSILLWILLNALPAQAQAALRLGVLGDSGTDEYRGTDNRGGDYANVTFNWVEQLALNRGISLGRFAAWGEPRRTGLEYNWSRSGATSASLLTQGQHTGLAGQIRAGLIDLAVVNIGFNDFAPYTANGYVQIYDGTLSGAALTSKINSVVANITTAVDTLRSAGSLPIIVTTIGNWNYSPLVTNDARFSDPAKRQRVTDAIQRANQGITAMANARGLTLFDSTTFLNSLMWRVQGGSINVGGVLITLFSTGDNPINGILGDRIHAGTVLSGLIANYYLTLINAVRSPDIPLFTDQEILQTAGLISTGGNQPPVASNDAASTAEDTTLTISAPGVLNNDSDPNGSAITAQLVSGPTRGSLTLNSSGSFTYVPNANVNGSDSFTYRASDGSILSNLATVTITITAVNDLPIANPDSFTTRRNTPITLQVSAILANDSDVDGDTLTATSATLPANGTFLPAGSTALTYTPRANFTGVDTFSYTISDGHGGTASATVTITVTV